MELYLPRKCSWLGTWLTTGTNLTFCRCAQVPYHESVGGVEVRFHAFLTSAPDRGEMLAFVCRSFTPGKKPPICIGKAVLVSPFCTWHGTGWLGYCLQILNNAFRNSCTPVEYSFQLFPVSVRTARSRPRVTQTVYSFTPEWLSDPMKSQQTRQRSQWLALLPRTASEPQAVFLS